MLKKEQSARYARHLLLPQFGEEAQERLLESKVLLIGAGGLGSPLALYLVAAGIGQLTIIDPDSVELSNLQRQIIHSEDSVGQPKVESAGHRLRALNSGTSLTLLHEPFTAENALNLVEAHDVIVDGTDNFPTRFMSNDACHLAGKPLIYGSIYQYEGQLTVFHTKAGSPCYRCLVPAVPEEGAVPNCMEAGVIGTLPGIIGSLQAMEVIKFIAGVGSPPLGKMLYYEALNTNFRTITLQKDPACPLCSASPEITTLAPIAAPACTLEKGQEITMQELLTLMEKTPDLLLIDVREPEEYAVNRIPKSQLIPLGSLEQHLPSLPKERAIYVHCHSGMRSLKAIQLMQNHGFSELINVKDGISGL